jgi:hypothetical protein
MSAKSSGPSAIDKSMPAKGIAQRSDSFAPSKASAARAGEADINEKSRIEKNVFICNVSAVFASVAKQSRVSIF